MSTAPRGSPARHALAIVVAAVAAARCHAGEPPPVAALAAQLAGEHCHYRAEYDRCSAAPLFSLEKLLQPRRHTCVWWAARCLEQRGQAAAAAVPALVAALCDGPNDFDTGDGVIAARSAVAGALAAAGDPAAVPALVHALEHARPYDRARISGAIASREPAARPALVAALASFGPRAAAAAPALAALLRERNADVDLNSGAAARIAQIEAMVPSRPDQPPRLYFDDGLAQDAAAALGSVGAVGEIPLLIASLDNRGSARGAAVGLGRLESAARAAAPRLRILLADPAYHADARVAAAQALGAIGDATAVPIIISMLADEALVDGCLPALAALGPKAAPAVPALAALVAAPSGAVRDGRGIHYGVRASTVHHRRLRAVDALAAVGDELAFAVLAKTLTDSEIGPAACRALRRLDPEGDRLRAAVAALPAARLAAYRRDRFQSNPCLECRP
jgi:HEAT repeat protein